MQRLRFLITEICLKLTCVLFFVCKKKKIDPRGIFTSKNVEILELTASESEVFMAFSFVEEISLVRR